MRAPKITFTLPDGTTVDTQTQRRFVLLGQVAGRPAFIARRSDDPARLRAERRGKGFSAGRSYFLADRTARTLTEI
jgi:hypothetical protein